MNEPSFPIDPVGEELARVRAENEKLRKQLATARADAFREAYLVAQNWATELPRGPMAGGCGYVAGVLRHMAGEAEKAMGEGREQ